MNTKNNFDNREMLKGGVYRIVCTATNKAYFDGVPDLVYPIMLEDFGCLACGTFPNSEMVQDYGIHGANSFIGEVLFCGDEFEKDENLELTLKKVKAEWRGDFY